MRRVALNASANVRRRRGREAVALRRLGPAPDTVSFAADVDEELWRHVRQLPEQQRWAVVLYYVEDRRRLRRGHCHRLAGRGDL